MRSAKRVLRKDMRIFAEAFENKGNFLLKIAC
mgnify:CR=1 FL=1